MATTKEIKNWEWIKSVEVQYMGFLTQYLGTPPNSKSITRILYNRYGNAHTRNYLLLIDSETQTRNCAWLNNVSYQRSDGRIYRP